VLYVGSHFPLIKILRLQIQRCVLVAVSIEVMVVSFVNKGVIYEHWLYLPMVGLSLALAYLLYLIFRNIKVLRTVIVVLICVYSVMTFQRNKIWQDKILFWEDGLKSHANWETANDSLASIYIVSGNYKKAKEYLLANIKKGVKHYVTYTNLGLLEYEQGNTEEAIRYYRKALSSNGDYISAQNNLGIVLLENGELEEAKELFYKILRQNRFLAEPRLNLAVIYKKQKMFEEAIVLCKENLSIDPGHADTFIMLLGLYFGSGQNDKAVQIGKDILKRSKDIKVLNGSGSIFANNAFINMAGMLYTKAVVIDKENSEAYLELGKIYGNMEEFDRAIEVWEEGQRYSSDAEFQVLINSAKNLAEKDIR